MTTEDREFKRDLRDLLSGLRGKERAATKWWAACLHRAGYPIHARYGYFPGPYDMAELRERFEHADPKLLSVFEESYRESCLEWQGRMGRPYTPNPLPRDWPV